MNAVNEVVKDGTEICFVIVVDCVARAWDRGIAHMGGNQRPQANARLVLICCGMWMSSMGMGRQASERLEPCRC